MAVFSYVARDESGGMVQGEVTAASKMEAARQIRGEGKFVVKVEPKGTAARAAARQAKGLGSIKIGGDKFKPEDVIYFTNQMAVMIDTGVSMAEALEAGVHDGNSPRFAKALDQVIDQVQGGSEFSAALAAHPKIFPTLYVNLIKASEASGMMGPILKQLADYMENQREMIKKIKGAVTYPIVMLTFAVGVTVFLMTFVLPKFAEIYAGKEDSLPKITRFLLAFSGYAKAYWMWAVPALIAAAVGLFLYWRTPKGRLRIEQIKLGMPLIGPLYHKTYLVRSLHTLGTMLQAGVSILDAVQLTSGVCGSIIYERMWKRINEHLEAGRQLSQALAEFKQVPKPINKMLSAGERSGKLGEVMIRAAHSAENELNISIKSLTSMIEPAIVSFLGIVVGGLVLALLLPIFTISKTMK